MGAVGCAIQRSVATPMNPEQENPMQHKQLSPDEALAVHPLEYSGPELLACAEEQAEDILDSVVQYMPALLPVRGALLIFMLAFMAVFMA